MAAWPGFVMRGAESAADLASMFLTAALGVLTMVAGPANVHGYVHIFVCGPHGDVQLKDGPSSLAGGLHPCPHRGEQIRCVDTR